MPNRYLRESILTSEPVNQLGPHAEVFYRRLMSVVDDYGRIECNPKLLRASCYPLRVDEVREADISRWLTEVESAGLIALYAVNGKNYLEFHKLGEPRAKSSKYPAPNSHVNGCAQVKTFVPPPPAPSVPSSIPPPPAHASELAAAEDVFKKSGMAAADKCARVDGMNPAEALLALEYARSRKPRDVGAWLYSFVFSRDFEPASHVTVGAACRWARAGILASICGHEVNGPLSNRGDKFLVIGDVNIPEKELRTETIQLRKANLK